MQSVLKVWKRSKNHNIRTDIVNEHLLIMVFTNPSGCAFLEYMVRKERVGGYFLPLGIALIKGSTSIELNRHNREAPK